MPKPPRTPRPRSKQTTNGADITPPPAPNLYHVRKACVLSGELARPGDMLTQSPASGLWYIMRPTPAHDLDERIADGSFVAGAADAPHTAPAHERPALRIVR